MYAHERKMFMLHDKSLVISINFVIYENVNWSLHAMVSGGTTMVHNDKRALKILVGLNAMMPSWKLKLQRIQDLKSANPCAQCAAHLARLAHGCHPTIFSCSAGRVRS